MKYDKEIVVKWFADHGIDAVPEFRFDPHRKWRFDFVLMPSKLSGPEPHKQIVALEVQGGLFTNGRHSRGAALLKEHEKLNAAACQNWRILYCIPDDLCTTDTVELIKRALQI